MVALLEKEVPMRRQGAASMSRREFLGGVTLAGTAGLLGLHPRSAAAEPPPETSTLRVLRSPSLCEAPAQVAATLLAAEGFTDVQYVQVGGSAAAVKGLTAGEIDLGLLAIPGTVLQIDADHPLVILGGVHAGCFEFFGSERVHSVRDLKGKTVAIPGLGTNQHAYVAMIAAYVGLDPGNDLHWQVHRGPEAMRLLAEGRIDGFIGFPPEPQELRAKKIGRVLVSTTTDRPWSQYFCCMITANADFVRQHPVATKRAMRAIFKADVVCALESGRVARQMVESGYTTSVDLAERTLREIPYGRWRQYDAEDTVRFFALRLYEVGMIKSTPQKIIAQGTDWRFLNELKKELKG
jgi:NitT/TauT family transport system substrate-binding protein